MPEFGQEQQLSFEKSDGETKSKVGGLISQFQEFAITIPWPLSAKNGLTTSAPMFSRHPHLLLPRSLNFATGPTQPVSQLTNSTVPWQHRMATLNSLPFTKEI